MYTTFKMCSSNVCYLVSMKQNFFSGKYHKFIVVNCSNVDKYSSISFMEWGPSWSWSYGGWIYNYMCNQYLSPLMLWVWIPLMAGCTPYNIMR